MKRQRPLLSPAQQHRFGIWLARFLLRRLSVLILRDFLQWAFVCSNKPFGCFGQAFRKSGYRPDCLSGCRPCDKQASPWGEVLKTPLRQGGAKASPFFRCRISETLMRSCFCWTVGKMMASRRAQTRPTDAPRLKQNIVRQFRQQVATLLRLWKREASLCYGQTLEPLRVSRMAVELPASTTCVADCRRGSRIGRRWQKLPCSLHQRQTRPQQGCATSLFDAFRSATNTGSDNRPNRRWLLASRDLAKRTHRHQQYIPANRVWA